jgi:hypothetical protein
MGSEVLIVNHPKIEIDNHNPNFWIVYGDQHEDCVLLDVSDLDVKIMEDLRFLLDLEIKRSKDEVDFDGYFEAVKKRFEHGI